MTYYMVVVIDTSIVVEVLGVPCTRPLTYLEGMVGACPVFKNFDDAVKYAKEYDAKIVEVEGIENKTKK